jgi:hypothetical protein
MRIRAHQARLWRLILTQNTEGYWDASSTVAFALLARTATEVAELKSTWLDRLKERLADVADLAEDVLSDGVGSAVRDRGGEQELGQQRSLASHKSMARSDSTVAAAVTQEVSDDPLVCFPGAISAAMPRRLAALLAADADLELERVWCTLTVIAVLETFNVGWLWGDGDVYAAEERTIVDAAREWVEGCAAEHPALHAGLADGAVATAASRTVAQWHRAWDARVSELRRVEAITEHHGRSHIHRTCCELMRAFTTKHQTVRACSARCAALRCAALQCGTCCLRRQTLTPHCCARQFAAFLSAPLDGLQRWQMFMVRVVLLCCARCRVRAMVCSAPGARSSPGPRLRHRRSLSIVISQLLVNSARRRGCTRALRFHSADALLRAQYGCSTPRESTAAPRCSSCWAAWRRACWATAATCPPRLQTRLSRPTSLTGFASTCATPSPTTTAPWTPSSWRSSA